MNLKFKTGDRVFNKVTCKWVNIIGFDIETGLYIVRYDDGIQGRSLESEMIEGLVEQDGRMYPYKIGDRVVLKGSNRCATITDLKYNSSGNLSYYIKIDNDKDISTDCPTRLLSPYDNMIEGLVKEETKFGTASNPIEPKSNANCLIQERVDELIKPPKFKVGDKITNGKDKLLILNLVSDKYIVEDNLGECGTVYFNTQDGWKLVEEEIKSEPKFHIGDWVTDGISKYQIHFIDDNHYWYSKFRILGNIESVDKRYHLYTIQDAKDGDVLAEDSCIFIIQKLDDNSTAAKTHCTLYDDGDFDDGSILYFDIDSTKPATEEEKQKLFKAIKDNNYKWNLETKTLEKLIESKFGEYSDNEPLNISKMTTDFIKEIGGLPCPDGYIFKDENGNVINATKIVLEKKRNEYPKTYTECYQITGLSKTSDIYGYKNGLLFEFQKLLIARDAYWQIAGDEMGLGKPWEPDWTANNAKYSIYTIKGVLTKATSCYDGAIFVFPTPEIRDAFYENFKSEIESCKELL